MLFVADVAGARAGSRNHWCRFGCWVGRADRSSARCAQLHGKAELACRPPTGALLVRSCWQPVAVVYARGFGRRALVSTSMRAEKFSTCEQKILLRQIMSLNMEVHNKNLNALNDKFS